jgi:hypothetical protein
MANNDGGYQMNEQVLGELNMAWNHRKPNDPMYAELTRLLGVFETDHAAVLDGPDGPRVGVFDGERIFLLSSNDHGLIIESKLLPMDVLVRREATGREQRQTRGGMTFRWSFKSPTDRGLDLQIEGWVSDHQEPDPPESLAQAMASAHDWPSLSRED